MPNINLYMSGLIIPGASKLVQRGIVLASWQNILGNMANLESQEYQTVCRADGKRRETS